LGVFYYYFSFFTSSVRTNVHVSRTRAYAHSGTTWPRGGRGDNYTFWFCIWEKKWFGALHTHTLDWVCICIISILYYIKRSRSERYLVVLKPLHTQTQIHTYKYIMYIYFLVSKLLFSAFRILARVWVL